MIRAIYVLAVALVPQAFEPSTAEASCIAPEFKLLWSYPAPGASEVPVNADGWALATGWGLQVSATLNGEPVPAESFSAGSMRFDFPPLAANTDYMLELTYETSDEQSVDGGLGSHFQISFRTGERTAEVPDAPVVTQHTIAPTAPLSECNDVLNAQDCFDTGPGVLLSYTVRGADALAWIVQSESPYVSNLWPNECGAPTLRVHESARPCHTLRALGDGGQLSAPVEYCTGDSDEPVPSKDSGASADRDRSASTGTGNSCSAGQGSTSAGWPLALLTLLGAWLGRRSRRRAHSL